MKIWLTAKEAAGLPEMPGSEQGTKKRLKKAAIGREDKSRKREGSKAIEYHISLLPKEAQDAWQQQVFNQLIGENNDRKSPLVAGRMDGELPKHERSSHGFRPVGLGGDCHTDKRGTDTDACRGGGGDQQPHRQALGDGRDGVFSASEVDDRSGSSCANDGQDHSGRDDGARKALPAINGNEGQSPSCAIAAGEKRPVKAPKKDADLTDKERRQRDCGLMLADALDAMHYETGVMHKPCCYVLAEQIISGTASPELIEAFKTIRTRTRKKAPADPVKACGRRLEHVLTDWRKGLKIGEPGAFLVPGVRQKEPPKPENVRAYGIFYCIPTRPPLKEAWRNSKDWYAFHGLKHPSYDVWREVRNRLPVALKYRGRMTGGAIQALLPYIKRSVKDFFANDFWVGDGHSFKAKVRHPDTGKAFTPEVTAIIDWVSRRIVGWSVDLSESTIAVSAAFLNAQQQTKAKPLIYYSDNGSGQTGKKIDHEIYGTLSRQGIGHQTGIPGNAQARGIIERVWKHTTIALARTYPTCTAKDADPDAVRKMLQRLNRVDEGDQFVPSWRQFIDDLDEMFQRYNAEHRHSELKGKTPNETYAERIDLDSLIPEITADELSALWRPGDVRMPRRGVIRLWNNEYFNKELPDMLEEKQKVQVRWDIHDFSKIWVYHTDGRFICESKLDGHAVDAFPRSYVEHQRDIRAEGRIKRAENIIDDAIAERDTRTLEHDNGSPLLQTDLTKAEEDEIMSGYKKESEPEKKQVGIRPGEDVASYIARLGREKSERDGNDDK